MWDVTIGAGSREDVPLRVWAPVDEGPFPAVVLSHGGGGSGAGFEYLVREWAAAGYVVLLPTHRDSLALQRQGGADMATAFAALRNDVNDPAAWRQRAVEVSAVIDQLPNLGGLVPELGGRVDPSRVVVGGHSFGAFTAMLVAGVEPDVGGAVVGVRDDRPVAFVLLSPQGVGQQGLTASSFAGLDRPALVMTGTLDRGQTALTADGAPQGFEDKLDPFELSPPGDKTAVIIDGATHFTFSGPGSGRALGGLVGDNPDTAPETYDAVVWGTLSFLGEQLPSSSPALREQLDPSNAPAEVMIRRR
jgi:predicted dienelactone hydrolase